MQERLRNQPGVEQVVIWGNELRVCGTDQKTLEKALEKVPELSWHEVPTSLEEVFIYLVDERTRRKGECVMAFSFQRLRALIIKEFTQFRRDRSTFVIIIIMPVLQLLIFGLAINTNPKYLPSFS